MKTAKLLAVAAVTLWSIPVLAQHAAANVQQSSSASAAGTQVNESTDAGASADVNHGGAEANGSGESSMAADGHGGADTYAHGSGASAAEMRPVTGELQGKLDSKTAKVGEPVVLKTTEKARTADGMVIPKGSRLIGHVTEVQAHERGHEESELGITFDRAELRNGQSMAIHSMIESVNPSAAALEASSMANDDSMAGPVGGGAAMAGGGRAVGGGHVGGGGLLGGAGGAVGGVSSATGRVGSDLGATANDAVHTTGDVAGSAMDGVDRGVDGSVSGAESLGMHATGIPGVMLESEATGAASGRFSAAKRNIHFDSGTEMVVGVAARR